MQKVAHLGDTDGDGTLIGIDAGLIGLALVASRYRFDRRSADPIRPSWPKAATTASSPASMHRKIWPHRSDSPSRPSPTFLQHRNAGHFGGIDPNDWYPVTLIVRNPLLCRVSLLSTAGRHPATEMRPPPDGTIPPISLCSAPAQVMRAPESVGIERSLLTATQRTSYGGLTSKWASRALGA